MNKGSFSFSASVNTENHFDSKLPLIDEWPQNRISKFLTDSNSERVAHIQAAQRQRLISCESPPFSSSKFIISDPSRTLARCLQVKWQMFPNRRQGQRQNDRCGSLASPSLFSSVPVESLVVLSPVVVSYFITFNVSDLISEKVSIKNGVKYRLKILIT